VSTTNTPYNNYILTDIHTQFHVTMGNFIENIIKIPDISSNRFPLINSVIVMKTNAVSCYIYNKIAIHIITCQMKFFAMI